MELPDRREAKSWEGLPVVDLDGAPLGTCAAVFADTDTGIPEWLQLGETGEGRSFVPALDASESGGTVTVAFPASAVDAAPRVGGLAELSKDDERRLYAHYGVPVSTAAADSLLPADAEPAAAEPAAAPPPVAAVVTTAPLVTAGVEPAPVPAAPAPSPLLAPSPPAAEQAPSTSGGLGAAAAPLGAAAAFALAGGLAARALRARSRRRNRPAARIERAKGVLSTRAAATAGAGRAQWLAAGATTADAAAKRRKAASKEAAKRKRAAAKRKDAALKGAAGRKDAASKAAASHARAASAATTATLGATRKAASSTTSGVTAAAGKAGRKVHKGRRGVARNLWQALVAGTAGTAYVLGAKAGEQRYAQIAQQASQLAAQPPVQQVVDLVTDAEGREQLKQAAEQQGSALLGKVRSTSSS